MVTRKSFLKMLVALVAISASTISCSKIDEIEQFDAVAQHEKDLIIIEDYIASENLDTYDIKETGVNIEITEEGTEDTDIYPTNDTSTDEDSQYVTVKYKGYFTDGTVFDDQTAEGDSITFPLDGVIIGWQLAIPEMTKGDKATVIIPSYYGYGNYAIGTIPASTVLVFDIELLSFERK